MTFWWNRAYIKIISNCSYLSICWWNVMPRYLISPAIYRHLTSVLQIWLRFTSKHGFLTRNWDVSQQNIIDRYLLGAIPNIAYLDVPWWRNCRSLHLPPCPCPRTQQAEGQLSSPPAAAYWLFKTDLRCIFTLHIIVFICPLLRCIYMISSGSGIKVIY